MRESRQFLLLLIYSFTFAITLRTSAQTLYWQSITSDIPVYDLLYDGVQNLYYSGGSGNTYFYRSTDLGNTWTQLGNGSLRLYRIAIDSNGVLWGGNDTDGGIYKSTNQGESWVHSLNSNDKITSITVGPNNWIWAGTYDGKILFSSNEGNSWEAKNFNESISSIKSNNINFIFVGSGNGKIYRSTDLGINWELLYQSTGWSIIKGILVDNDNYIYANLYGRSERILSTNNGITWVEILGPNLSSLYINSYHQFFGGVYSGGGYRSLDSCLTWQYIGPTWPNDPNSFTFIDSIIFVGTPHGVFKYDPTSHPYLAENYFPLNIGNIWQFNTQCNGDFAGNAIYYVEKDSIISGKKYFLLQGDVNDWVRYDPIENRLFLRWNDSDYVVMDYTLNEGSTFQRILFNNHQIKNVTVLEPLYLNIFDSSYHTKGSFWGDSGPPSQSHATRYSENLGETKLDSYYNTPGGGSSHCTRKMIRAILVDSSGTKYFTNHESPEISLQPILGTAEFEIFLSFIVDHLYSYFTQYWDVNFIDSVAMFSYYSNGDSTILNEKVIAENIPSSINYSLLFSLDSTLMKNDFKFYYKIIAVDKGVVPEYSSLPDTGYFELIYDPNYVSVDDRNETNISNYRLEQNYPNPFNPSTKISYTVKEQGNVEVLIYDVLGNLVNTLVKERKSAGKYSTIFNASQLASGIYFYSIRVNDFVQTKKMVLLR